METHHYPPSMRALIRSLARLPGLGAKSAERMAVHLLRAPRQEAEALAGQIVALKDTVRLCRKCHALSDAPLCSICCDPGREQNLLCVVERPGDMVAIEKSGAFNGVYHILQGVLSPMEGIGPDALRIRELMERIENDVIGEVILATGTSVEGEATAAYLSGILKEYPVQITRIASGVPMGGDLKYIDQVTIKRAMEGRYGCG